MAFKRFAVLLLAVLLLTGPLAYTVRADTQEEHFVLTFVGDCTLGSMPGWFGRRGSFVGTVGTNYDHPFQLVKSYFQDDEFTMLNLEGVLANSGKANNKRFVFRGPNAYVNILTDSSVEGVTLANNHSMDFGRQGYNNTIRVLNDAGIVYAQKDKTKLITTKNGLKLGIYADEKDFSTEEITKNVQALKQAGAEVIICAFHWGKEGAYRPNTEQKKYANDALEAGAHIVYGHHPHVLQKIEKQENGVIYYSLGNFSFGGNPNPRDKDSAIIRQEIIRGTDGSIRLGQTETIPVRITSVKGRNNYQPIPYEAGTEGYLRTLSKLDGTYTGRDLPVYYAKPQRLGEKPGASLPQWD